MKGFFRRYRTLLLFGIVLIEMYLLRPLRFEPTPENPKPYVLGAIHLHSQYSDGGGSIAEIATAAERAGLDFIVLTDHNTSAARREGFEKRMGSVDVFVEMEASLAAGHLLTFYSHTPARDLEDETVRNLSWKHFLGEGHTPGLFVVVAHPTNIKNPWTRLDRVAEGLEVVNFDSNWQFQLANSVLGFSLTAALIPFNNFLSALRFFQHNPKDFQAWDTWNSVQPGRIGILAHDTHAKLKLNDEISLRWPDYLPTFRLAANVVLLDAPLPQNFEQRKKMIYTALSKGRLAFVYHAIHPFRGNHWNLQCPNHNYIPGDTLPFSPGCEFVISTPSTLQFTKRIKLIRDGELAFDIATRDHEIRLPLSTPGSYRLEVWVNSHTPLYLLLGSARPYVIYNPIYVR